MQGRHLSLLAGVALVMATAATAAPITGEYVNKNGNGQVTKYSFDEHARKVNVFMQFDVEVC